MSSNNKVIELKDVDICQKEQLVLSNVSFDVRKNEFVYLIGKVGSGKSSLLKTLYADLELKNGNGQIAGFSLENIKSKEIPFLRRKLGVVFQDFQLLIDRSIYDNLVFVLKATGWKKKHEIDIRVKEVLDRVKLIDKINKMPHQLSGGEQQRIVIARAMLNDPEIILADEPTGNLDPETSEGIMEILFNIKNSGRSIVMATHNYYLLKKFAARTYKCIDGKLIEHSEDDNTIDFENLKDFDSM